MSPTGFETTASAGEQPPTYALDCEATGTGNRKIRRYKNGGKYYAGVQNLGIPSAGRNPAPLTRKAKKKKEHCGKKYFILLLHFAWLSNSITAYIAFN